MLNTKQTKNDAGKLVSHIKRAMTMHYLSRNQTNALNSFHLIYEDFQIYLVHYVLQYSFINDKSQAFKLVKRTNVIDLSKG